MTILNSLVGLYERLAADETAPAVGFSRENISYAVILSLAGEVVDVQDIRDTSTGKPRPTRRDVPRAVIRVGQPLPNFLWDKTTFALGAGTREPVLVEREHAAFKDFHRQLLETCEDHGARAFLRFLDRWRAEDFEKLRYAEDMRDANVVFRIDGAGLEFLHERPFVRDIWLKNLEQGEKGLCLVTGERAAIARLHPPVKGVTGGQPSGTRMVSFDKDAFKSFGKERGANAPVSERAAFSYTAALNTLLERDSRRRIRIGDATTVFWAEAARDEAHAAAAEDLFSAILEPPPTDEEETVKVADRLAAVAEGRPLAEVSPDVDEDTRFCVLGLAPNAARVSIRFWHRNTIGELARRIGQHWRDLRLEPAPWRTPPAAWRLLLETAPRINKKRDAKKIPPTLGGALMRAILGGGRYPRSLLAAIVGRMRADRDVTVLQAAICKMCIIRDLGEEGVPVSLSREEVNPAYRLGRLFAVYESVQRAALPGVNATIKDRYFGAASATPASVFPLLERNSAHHLASLRKGERGGLAHWFDREIDEILAGMGTEFPRSLRLEDQGRFAIGYHHQRETKRKDDREDDGSSASAIESDAPFPVR